MKIILFLLISLLAPAVQAAAQDLVIGCTYKCDIFYQRAIKLAAKNRGLKVKIIDLSKDQKFNLDELDGVVVPGGVDINPALYFPHIEESLREYTKSLDSYVNYTDEGKRRDAFELPFLKKYFEDEDTANLPVLGVCRGMQMLAVSQGIPLYVDIKKELGIRNRRYLFDRIHVEEMESLMNDFFGHSFWGFKRHHQGIRVEYFHKNKARWPELEITAYSNGGVIAESLEFQNRPVLGVQFHPENDFGYERRTIFGWLIDKAIKRQEVRQTH